MIDFSKKKTKKQKIAAAIICLLIVFGMVGGLTIENVKSHEVKTLEVSGVFIATGNNPNSSYTPP